MPTAAHSAQPSAKRATSPDVRKMASEYLRKDPGQRILFIRNGLDAEIVDRLVDSLRMSKKALLLMVGLSRSTIDRKISAGMRLSSNESESILAVLKLVAQAQKVVEESGNPDGFNAATWVSEWLSRPHAALGGQNPGEFMDTAEGRALVGDLLLRQQSAAYS
jgi:putative toxin-antitoxin system antitoxin component (TIGR02293 family)